METVTRVQFNTIGMEPKVELHFVPRMLFNLFGMYFNDSPRETWSIKMWVHQLLADIIIVNNFWVLFCKILQLIFAQQSFLSYVFIALLCLITLDASIQMGYIRFRRNKFFGLLNDLSNYSWDSLPRMKSEGYTSWGSIPSIDRWAAIFLVFATFGTGLAIIYSLINGTTVYDGLYPWDSKIHLWFSIQFLSDSTAAIVLTQFGILFCYFYVKIIVLLCARFDTLEDSLRDITYSPKELRNEYDSRGIEYGWQPVIPFYFPRAALRTQEEKLRVIVQHHQDLYSLMAALQDLISIPLLVKFIQSGLIVCFAVFMVLRVTEYNYEFFLSILFFLYEAPHLVLYCWFGTKLTDRAHQLREAAYDCEWYNMPKGFKMSILTIMIRCDKKFHLKVGKFTNVSVETLIVILQSIFSYMALMSSLTEKIGYQQATTNSTMY